MIKEYDYLIVGAGFYGSICAHELSKFGFKVLVIDNRNHVGGNCYTENRNGVNIQIYGAHIFHTSNKEIWDWINQFAEFNSYRHHVLANYKDEIYSLPFSMFTFNKLWGVNSPEEAQKIINEQSLNVEDPLNLEEQALKFVGVDVYEKLIKGYTSKQWMKDPRDLPKEIIKRLPIRFTWDNNYFFDKYQGIPNGGYTQIFDKLLDGIDVQLNTDYFVDKLPRHKKVIYTGPIDKYFNYKHGKLEYKTVRFEHQHLNTPNYQGVAVMNYTDCNIPFTRVIEHKHFESPQTDTTWITHEFPQEYVADVTEPFYPVNDSLNNNIFLKYKDEAVKIKDKIIFGGRLGEYKYYDMHQVIESALTFIKNEINGI
jgi:UDP-galactopyranose mutase